MLCTYEGYQTEIFELHDQPGGLCTSWQRQGYVFDGCLYDLFGSGVGQPFYQVWQELGAVQECQFIHHDELMRVIEPNNTLIVYSSSDRLEAHLKHISPADRFLTNSSCLRFKLGASFTQETRQWKRQRILLKGKSNPLNL